MDNNPKALSLYNAVAKYNEGLVENHKLGSKTTLIASANQIGLKVEF